MRRALLLLLAFVAVTWLEFQFVPGHTYLRSGTQVYVPVLEHLDNPGLLSRDLVAVHPNVTYTIYDEVTLFLHDACRLSLHAALLIQQLVSRFAALLGLYLLFRSARLTTLEALLIAAVLNLGAYLPGPELALIDPEPVPPAIAFGFLLLSAGLFAREKPLLAGLTGGLAFVYDPRLGVPLWLIVALAMIFDRGLRRMLRPSLPIFAIFVLLLANLAQLQPGVPELRGFFDKVPSAISRIQQFRSPGTWVSVWARHEIWLYLGLLDCGLWAAARIWPMLNRQVRWFLIGFPALGMLSVPLSWLLLDVLRWSLIPPVRPAHLLIFVVAFSAAACAIAGTHAIRTGRRLEAIAFFAVVAVLPASQFLRPPENVHTPEVIQIARWAQDTTWGGSMFLFPQAGRDLDPGLFRAEAKRAVWVDWQTGQQVNEFDSFADEWWRRWHDTMEGPFSNRRLARMLSLPIDYFVLKRETRLPHVKPVFVTPTFAVYDAQDLHRALPALEPKRED